MIKDISIEPKVTEKTSALLEENKFTFYVSKEATKIDVSCYIKAKFGVDVSSVNILKQKGKKRRRGAIRGKTSDRKKAIVTVKAGQSVDGLKEVF